MSGDVKVAIVSVDLRKLMAAGTRFVVDGSAYELVSIERQNGNITITGRSVE